VNKSALAREERSIDSKRRLSLNKRQLHKRKKSIPYSIIGSAHRKERRATTRYQPTFKEEN